MEGYGYKEFSELMEKELGGKERIEFTSDFIEKFWEKIDTLPQIRGRLVYNFTRFFDEIFGSEKRRRKTPLYTDRDYALEIHEKIFSIRLSSKKDLTVSKVRFFAFLVGIIEDPWDEEFDLTLNPIRLFASTSEFILLSGETGTGKELYATVIHNLSPRLKEPFIPINCSGVSGTLLESSLFGIVKGFATDVKEQTGLLQTVGKGTLFLDEIGDMPLFLQAQFLRVLETKDFYKVGDYKNKLKFQGRVIAATNKDLRAEIEAKRFREDLYYRLSVLKIDLEPLRSLTEDSRKKIILKMLGGVFDIYKDESDDYWERFRTYSSYSAWYIRDPNSYGQDGEPYYDYEDYISEEALQALISYRWPGNYREMRNLLTRSYILAEQKRIELKHLPSEVRQVDDTVHPENRDLNDIKVIDLFDYADQERREIFRRKIQQVYESGKDLKGVLRVEGIHKQKGYTNIRNKIERILGNGELKRIRKQYQNR